MIRKALYLASPYSTPDPIANAHASFYVASAILAAGVWVPHVPHLTVCWHLVSPHPADLWRDYEAQWLQRCDAVFRLPGRSASADEAVALARTVGVPVIKKGEALVGTRWADHDDADWDAVFDSLVYLARRGDR